MLIVLAITGVVFSGSLLVSAAKTKPPPPPNMQILTQLYEDLKGRHIDYLYGPVYEKNFSHEDLPNKKVDDNGFTEIGKRVWAHDGSPGPAIRTAPWTNIKDASLHLQNLPRTNKSKDTLFLFHNSGSPPRLVRLGYVQAGAKQFYILIPAPMPQEP